LIQIAVSASRIQQAKGNSHRASELLIQLKLKIKSPDYASFMLRIEAEQVCLSLQQGGALEEALGWEQRCGLTSTDEVSMNRIAEYLTLARVMAVDGRADDALHLLERLQQLLIKEDALRDQIKVVIMKSVTLQRLGQTEAALLQLETALHLAEPEGYIRSFVDEGPLMAEMLTAYLKAQQANLLDSSSASAVSLIYVKQLLQALKVNQGEGILLKGILTEQETKVMQLIALGLSNKEIAHRLSVTSDTVKFHIKNMYRKLGVNNRVQAMHQAKEHLQII
jgi:LuxR family maltose regulon positive regulatory protein